jgi:hypothetical protein
MIFKLSTKSKIYNNVEDMNYLISLGFSFKSFDSVDPETNEVFEGMRITGEPTIEINSAEEICELSKNYTRIIIEGDKITFFDDYLD